MWELARAKIITSIYYNIAGKVSIFILGTTGFKINITHPLMALCIKNIGNLNASIMLLYLWLEIFHLNYFIGN